MSLPVLLDLPSVFSFDIGAINSFSKLIVDVFETPDRPDRILPGRDILIKETSQAGSPKKTARFYYRLHINKNNAPVRLANEKTYSGPYYHVEGLRFIVSNE